MSRRIRRINQGKKTESRGLINKPLIIGKRLIEGVRED